MARVIGPVAYEALAAWIAGIPFEDWPQQNRIDALLRPAMVTDLAWHGFGALSDPLVRSFGRTQQRMLSCVMPGHDIPLHRDEQPADFLYRVHVPLLTNARATFNGEHLPRGFAYAIDTREPHEVRNDGTTPRTHFMFDVLA